MEILFDEIYANWMTMVYSLRWVIIGLLVLDYSTN